MKNPDSNSQEAIFDMYIPEVRQNKQSGKV